MQPLFLLNFLGKSGVFMLKNYFFDFDKTLADTGDVSVTATQDAFKAFNLTVPDKETILDYMGIPAEISVPQMADVPLSDEQVTKICEEFRSIYRLIEFKNTKLYPGVGEMLTTLYQNHCNLFVVSSKASDPLNRNLENLGILSFFKDIVGCDQVKHYKPAPDGIDLLIEKYHLKKAESVMIGDARYDLQMGKNARVKTCGAKWGAFNPQSLVDEKPDYLIDEPLDILKLD